MTRQICIGFGEHEGVCPNYAGSTHSKHWCQRCDDLRRAHITAQLERITESFKQEVEA